VRLVTCYTEGNLREETKDAIWHHWGDSDFHVLSAEDPFAYGKVLRDYWNAGTGFFVVEPDIVIRADVVEAALWCECPYGCFPYPWLTDIGPALGCTWFRGSFTKKYPKAMDEVLNSRVSWKQLDVTLMRTILAKQYGEQPHVHLPPVAHLNEEKALLASANPVPLMEVPTW
jgi:hypothetical protein